MVEDVQRVLRLLNLLQQQGAVSVDRAAEHLGLGRAALLRLVELASLCGRAPFGPMELVDIYVDEERIHLELDQALARPLRLTEAEALALLVTLRDADAEAARSAAAKVEAALSDEQRARVQAMMARWAVDADFGDVYWTLEQGLRTCTPVEIEYYTARRDELTERTLSVYQLSYHWGSAYAIGHDSYRDDVRIFKVERIRAAALGAGRYTIPERYTGWPGTGTGRYTAKIRVEKRAHVFDQLEGLRLAEVVHESETHLTLSFPYPNLEIALGLILSFAPGAVVLEPPELQAALRERLQRIAALYD